MNRWACGLSVVALLVAGCNDDFYKRPGDECGLAGNCCWDNKTCNPGNVCNTQTMLCEVGESPIEDMGGATPDAPPAVDADMGPVDAAADVGDLGDGAVEDVGVTPDGTPPDVMPPDLPPPDLGPVKHSGIFQALEFVSTAPGHSENLVLYLPTFANPNVKPDWVFPALPPNCQGWKWKKGEYPKGTSGDAGKITFGKHQTVDWFDPYDPSVKGTVPANIECTLLAKGTTGWKDYDCGFPTPFATYGTMFNSSADISLSWSGGPDVPAKTFNSLSAYTTSVSPKAPFDINAVDPSKGITAQWESTKANIVGVGFLAQLADGSEFSRVFCATISFLGKKAIAQEGIDLFPKPTAGNPLYITTLMFGANLDKTGTASWGDWTILVSSAGVWGRSCVTPSGFCSVPPLPDAGPGPSPDAGVADAAAAD